MECVGRQLGLLYDNHHSCIQNCKIYTVYLKFTALG